MLFIVMIALFGYDRFNQWYISQERYIYSPLLIDIGLPPVTPTPIPTPTPTPVPLPPIHILIPKIGVNEAIVEVDWNVVVRDERVEGRWEAASYAVGYHKTSARPGEAGNIVLNGHNNTKGQVFKRLPELARGDEILLYTPDEQFEYIVEEVRIIRATGASPQDQAEMDKLIGPTSEETLTLVSCWPFATYTHRIFVIARPKS